MSRAGSVPLLPVYTGEQIRAAEQPLLDAGQGPELMRRAAFGLAQRVLGILSARGRVYGARVTGLIGPGNNGGDGLYALAFLRRRGVNAQALLVRDRCHEEGLAAFRASGGRCVDAVPPDTDTLIDAMLGTGFHGDFQLPQISGLDELLENHVVVACDLPSGVDAGTGTASEAVIPADHTVTFGAVKQGLLAGRGGQLSGQLHSVDIGLGEHLPETRVQWARGPAQPPGPTTGDHKYSRGVVHVVAGSQTYPGAAQLTAGAAISTGAGMITLQASPSVREQVIAVHPEVVGVSEHDSSEAVSRASCAVIGPGLAEERATLQSAESVLEQVLQDGTACVLDASGLGLIQDQLRRRGRLSNNVLITPHLGEARQLAAVMRDHLLAGMLENNSPREDQVEAVRRMAGRLDCTVLLKGATTVIASPQGEVILHRAEAPGLATAGTGDVLSGILGALAATSAGAGNREIPPEPSSGPHKRGSLARGTFVPGQFDGNSEVADPRGRISATTSVSEVYWLSVAALGASLHTQAAQHIDPHGRGHFGASSLLEVIGGSR